MAKKEQKSLIEKLMPLVMLLILALLILNTFLLYERRAKVNEAVEIMKEQSRPAELQLTKIFANNCSDCYDVNKAVEDLKSKNVKVNEETTLLGDSQEAKEIIKKYSIEKLPTIIVSGEINKTEQLNDYFEQKGTVTENAFVLTELEPPYLDVASNKVRGEVTVKQIVDSSCNNCLDLSLITEALKEQKVFVKEEQTFEYTSVEGQELIKNFEIKEVPSLLISENVEEYPDVKQALTQTGAVKKKGFHVVHATFPPYRDLAQDKIVGLVDVVYLTKDDCSECYDVSINRRILLQFGITLNEENTYDVNTDEAKKLIKKYQLNKVPMIILSSDAKYYPTLVQAWKSVGTIEEDGWFVMRKPEAIGPHWDLEANKLVKEE